MALNAPRRRLLRASAALTLAALGLGAATLRPPSAVAAQATALRAALVDPKVVRIDGLLREWPLPTVALSHVLKGNAKKPNLEAKALVAYDDKHVYVAADVTDDVLRGGADHVELALGFPGGTVHRVRLYPGEPGKSAGAAKTSDGAIVTGARVVEAPREGGYTLEASLPWTSFPQAGTVRVGLRGAVFVHDADSSAAVGTIVGTAPSAAYAALPSLATEPEQALADGLLKDKKLRGAPQKNLLGNVAGDALKERVLVFERWLVVLGPGFRGGTQYYFGDLGVDASQGMLRGCELHDVTGDGRSELVLTKLVGTAKAHRVVMQVLSFGSGDVPTPIFTHEIGVVTEKGSVLNRATIRADRSIVIETGEAKGFDADSYAEPRETSIDSVLLPWGPIKSRTYKSTGGTAAKISEEAQKPVPRTAPPPPAETQAAAPRPPAPTAGQLLEKVHDLYRKDRKASGKPRFDLAIDVAGGAEVERVLLHGRDLVVFGKGFKGGTAYAFLELSHFASGADIRDVTARDLTGDGKAELIVRGVLRSPASGEANAEEVVRDIVLVYKVGGDRMLRVFAAELGRAIGKKRIVGELRFVKAGRGSAIELAPGRAFEWTAGTYPFTQDNGPVGGLEPLLLPWGGSSAVRYTWSGNAFAK